MKIGIPNYLASSIDGYLRGWTLCYDTDNGKKEYVLSINMPHGSVLDIMYNDVLDLPVLKEVVGAIDDLAMLVLIKNLEDAELYSRGVISAVKA